MHPNFCPECPNRIPRVRGRFSPWIPAALIAAVLGAASLAAALTPDTRDFKSRHGTVLTSLAL